MSWKTLSLVALVVLSACVLWLYSIHSIFGAGPVTIAIQVVAALLMIWARLTFGIRSFHATANPTAGGLVRSGPYKYIRHPIYAAVLYFVWAGIGAHLSLASAAAGLLANRHDGRAHSGRRETACSYLPGISRVRADHTASHSVRALGGLDRSGDPVACMFPALSVARWRSPGRSGGPSRLVHR